MATLQPLVADGEAVRCGWRGRSLRTDGTNIADGCNVRPKLTTSKWASSEAALSDSSRFCIRKYGSEVPFLALKYGQFGALLREFE